MVSCVVYHIADRTQLPPSLPIYLHHSFCAIDKWCHLVSSKRKSGSLSQYLSYPGFHILYIGSTFLTLTIRFTNISIRTHRSEELALFQTNYSNDINAPHVSLDHQSPENRSDDCLLGCLLARLRACLRACLLSCSLPSYKKPASKHVLARSLARFFSILHPSSQPTRC